MAKAKAGKVTAFRLQPWVRERIDQECGRDGKTLTRFLHEAVAEKLELPVESITQPAGNSRRHSPFPSDT